METPAVALKANASVIPMRNTTLDHGDPRRSCVDKTTMVSSKRSNIWGIQLGTRFRNKGWIIKGAKKETTSSLLSSHFYRDNLTFHGRIFDQEADPKKVVAIVLGGGAGTRLFPRTERRAKPAVPIGGCYRIIDIPMSNCINSGVKKIYVLTQFNSELKITDIPFSPGYHDAEGKVPIGVGQNTKIRNCIIDKNAKIGKNSTITNQDGVLETDRPSERFYIRSGITVIAKNATVKDGTVI